MWFIPPFALRAGLKTGKFLLVLGRRTRAWPGTFEAAPPNEVKQKMLIEKVMGKREMGLKVLFAVTLPLVSDVIFG